MDEHMDLRRLRGLMRSWEAAPPVHVAVRGILSALGSSQPGPSSRETGEGDDLAFEAMMSSAPVARLPVPAANTGDQHG